MERKTTDQVNELKQLAQTVPRTERAHHSAQSTSRSKRMRLLDEDSLETIQDCGANDVPTEENDLNRDMQISDSEPEKTEELTH